MGPSELLRHVVDVLERLRVRYLVTGSVATIHYGEPRFTNDIDIVADLAADAVESFCLAFPGENFYVDENTIREAIADRGQFNIIHPACSLNTGFAIKELLERKVDEALATKTPRAEKYRRWSMLLAMRLRKRGA